MKPTGRRAWRRWCKRARLRMNTHHKTLYRAAIMRKKQPERTPMPLKDVKPLTARSLVGMSQSSRKRRRWEWVQAAGQYDAPGAAKAIGAKLRIGERLRPCPGCCACWGHRISTAYGEYAECSGPQINGKRKSQIKAMRKWQESLSDDCDGSGVLPARKQG